MSLIVGMDNQPMLFDSDSGKYHRLGAAAAFIVNQFDGVRPLPTIIEELPQDIDEAGAQRITGLVDNLRDKGLLAGGEPAPAVPEAPVRTRRTRGRHTAQPRQARHLKVERPRRSGGWWLPRIIIARKYHRIVAPIVTLLQRLPAPRSAGSSWHWRPAATRPGPWCSAPWPVGPAPASSSSSRRWRSSW